MIKIRLIKLLSHAKKYVWLQVIFQWISLLAQVLLIYSLTGLIFKLVDLLQSKNDFQFTSSQIIFPLIIIGLCIILRFLMDFFTSRSSFKASVDVKRILRAKIYEKLLRLGTSYRENIHSAEVVQLASEGVEQLEIYFGKYLSQFFYSLLCPLTLFAILSFVNLKAATVLLLCVPLIPLSIVVVMKIAKRLLHKYWGLYAELGDSFLENLQGLSTLKIYRADEKRAEEMDVESQKFRHVTMKVLTMQLNSTSVMDIMAYGGAALGMIVTLLQFRSGNVSAQGALMIILLASEFFIPLRLLGSFFHIAMNGMAASDKIFALLDLPENRGGEACSGEGSAGEGEPAGEGGPVAGTAQMPDSLAAINLRGLSFSYAPAGVRGPAATGATSATSAPSVQTAPAATGAPSRRQILSDINITCRPGITSFVGVSGSGKSTLAGILMGRNKGYKGEVTFEGKETLELKAISEDSLMKNLVMVSHDSYIFKGSIRENLLMAKPAASDSELESALSQVNLLDFVNASGGLDYQITEGASNLSGGQKQRLALARALLLDAQVYIFDEATSSIDAESEAMIMDVIHRLAKEKIIILISHRLANVTAAKSIYFLKDGKISESGNHKQLIEANGDYARLFNKQKALEAAAFTSKGAENGKK